MTKQVQWGIIGAGGIVERATGAALNRSERANLRAIATRGPDKVEFLKERYHPDTVYESYEALLDDPEIDAVYIAVPNALQDAWSLKALDAVKHVL